MRTMSLKKKKNQLIVVEFGTHKENKKYVCILKKKASQNSTTNKHTGTLGYNGNVRKLDGRDHCTSLQI